MLQGYLLPKVHGTYRRYFLELLVVAGLLLPWIGPAFGLAIMTPIVLLTVQNSKIITTERDCFRGGVGPTTCPATSYFDYYFWNLTNPDQVNEPSMSIFTAALLWSHLDIKFVTGTHSYRLQPPPQCSSFFSSPVAQSMPRSESGEKAWVHTAT